jgi:hypothetical protein
LFETEFKTIITGDMNGIMIQERLNLFERYLLDKNKQLANDKQPNTKRTMK